MRKRQMSLTAELVALCRREEKDSGFDPRLTPLTKGDQDGLLSRLLAESCDQPLYVFAYGSLIWNPRFEAAELFRGSAFGWHRSFCLEMTSWRGTPAQPGLMLALDRGGRCDGMVYRLPTGQRSIQLARIIRREVDYREDLDAIRWIPVRAGRNTVRALVFWAGPRGVGVLRKPALEDIARILARACGHVGSCAEYLFHTVSHLEELGIRDRNLWRLQELVAAEIAAIHRLKL